jgi:hypothetical protein
MVIHGVYNEKIESLANKVKIEYRFIPRSYYDEMSMSNTKFESMFEESSLLVGGRPMELGLETKTLDEPPMLNPPLQSRS